MATVLPDINVANPIALASEVDLTSKNGFIYTIIIDGKDIQRIGYSRFLNSIVIDQDIDKIDKLTLEFINLDRTDDEIFSEGVDIEISIGYASSRLVSFGKFKSQRPVFSFLQNGYRVFITAYSTSMNMAINQERTVYNGKTHSDICSDIILKYSLDGDIETTSDIYETIIQANETDYCFLRKLADMNGFVFFIRNNIVHFHGIRVGSDDVDNTNLILDFLNTRNNIIIDSKVEIYHIGKRKEFQKTLIDRKSGEYYEISVSDQNNLDGVLDITESTEIKKSLLAEKAISYDTKSGINNSVNELQKRLNSYKGYSDFIVKLKMNTFGIEELAAGKLIKIDRFNRFSGDYYISKIKHMINTGEGSSGYSTMFNCWKKFISPEQNARIIDVSLIDFLNENAQLFDVTNSSSTIGEFQTI